MNGKKACKKRKRIKKRKYKNGNKTKIHTKTTKKTKWKYNSVNGNNNKNENIIQNEYNTALVLPWGLRNPTPYQSSELPLIYLNVESLFIFYVVLA